MHGVMRKRYEDGGMVNGPGTSTSDSVPAMLSKGEYVVPADTAANIGVENLDAMRAATHKMAKGKQGAKGGRHMANGGLVDERQTDAMGNQTGPAALVATASAPPPAVTPASVVAPNTTNVINGATEDAKAAFKSGNYIGGVGQALRGVAALPVAAYQDTVGRVNDAAQAVVMPIAAGVGNALATAATGDSTPLFGPGASEAKPVAVASPPAPAPAKPGTPGAIAAGASTAGAGRGYVNPPVIGADSRPDLASGPALTGALGSQNGMPVDGAAGVRKFTTGDGRTLYSNVAGTSDNDKLMSGKPGVQIAPSASGMVAGGNFGATSPGAAQVRGTQPAAAGGFGAGGGADAGALYQARLAAVNRGDIDAVKTSYGAQGFNDSGLATPTTGNPVIDQLQAAVRNGKQLTAQGAQVLTQAQQVQAGARRDDQANQIAQQKVNIEASTHSQDAALKGSQIKLTQQMDAARAAYIGAKTEDERAKHMETLRALQGKYEREVPDLFTTSIIPGSNDPLNPRGAGAIVTDKRTGATRVITADEAAKGTASPALPPGMVKQVGTANGKPVYEDAKGKRFTGS